MHDTDETAALLRQRMSYAIECFSAGDWEECATCAFETAREHGWTYEFLVLTFVALLRSRGLEYGTEFLASWHSTYEREPWLLTLTELALGQRDLQDVFPRLERESERSDAYYFAGEFALACRDPEQALTFFRRAQSLNTRSFTDILAAAAVNHLLAASIREHGHELPGILDEVASLVHAGDVERAVEKAHAFAAAVDDYPLTPHVRSVCLNLVGWHLLQAGQYHAAEPLLADAVHRNRSDPTTEVEQVASSLHNWAAAKHGLGDLQEAETLYREVIERQRGATENRDRIESARALTQILQKTGRGEEARSTALDFAARLHHLAQAYLEKAPRYALECAEGALRLADAVLEPHATERASLLWSVGRALRAIDDLEGAQSYLEHALAASDPTNVTSRTAILNSLGANAADLGDTDRAMEVFREVITRGEHEPDALLASTYMNLASLASRRHEYAEAVRCLELSLTRIEQHEHERLLPPRQVYVTLLRVLLDSAQYARASAAGERALALPALEIEADTVELHLRRLTGLAYRLAGRYPLAIAHLEQALALCPEDPELDTLLVRVDLALAYTRVGRLTEADAIAHVAERDIGVWGGDARNRASILNQLAVLREEVHDFESAALLYQQAIAVHEDEDEDSHSDDLVALYNNLGTVRQKQGDLAEAQKHLDHALAVRRTQAPRSPRLAALLYNVGNQYEQAASRGRVDAASADALYVAAERHYDEALDILRDAGEQESLNYVLNTLALALVRHRRGDYAGAEPLYLEGMQLAERIGASLTLQIVHARTHLANLYAATNRPRLAVFTLAATLQAQSRFVAEVFSLTAETTRLEYVERSRMNLWAMLSLVSPQFLADAEINHIALDFVMRSKALVADAGALQRRLQAASADPHVEELAAEATALRKDSGSSDDAEARTRRNRRLDDIEVELARLVFADVRHRLHPRLEDLVAELPNDAALIEIAWYSEMRFETLPSSGDPRAESPRYLALIVRHGEPMVAAVDLGSANQIEALISEWRSQVLAPDSEWSDAVARRHTSIALREAIVDPLLARIGDVRRLFVCPDAELNLVPLEALEFDNGEFVLDRYQISYLSNARDLLRAAEPRTVRPGAPVVIADPEYGAGHSFTPLPGTRKEGEGVAALLGTSPWLGTSATKSRLLTVRSPIVLHIATHGFFLEKSDNVLDPLERSGLALAGANESTDGLLTAVDVAMLTLGATELVVLSACETGIGILLPGEGVFGLRRSFALAGVRTLVMSLWDVPDDITMDLILRFYRFLAAGRGRNDALRQARIEIRQTYPDPSNWGGFICQGDGAPLTFDWSA